MKEFELEYDFEFEDYEEGIGFNVHDFKFYITEDQLLKECAKIIDSEMETKFGALKDKGSCYQTLVYMVSSNIIYAEDLFEAYYDQLHRLYEREAEQEAEGSEEYYHFLAEAKSDIADREDWYGTRNNILGLW